MEIIDLLENNDYVYESLVCSNKNEYLNYGFITSSNETTSTQNVFNVRYTHSLGSYNMEIPIKTFFGVDKIRKATFSNMQDTRCLIDSEEYGRITIDVFLDSYLVLVGDEHVDYFLRKFIAYGFDACIVGDLKYIFIKRSNYNKYSYP